MNGRVIIALGLFLLVLGAFGLYFAYEAGSAVGSASAWAAIIFGVLTLLGGIARFMNDFMAPQQAPESEYGPTEIRLLIQAMGATAAADGRLADEEVATIADIHKRMLGIAIPGAQIREIMMEFDGGFDIAGRLAAGRARLSPTMRGLIFNSCYLVALADRDEDRAETVRIHDIGRALGFTDQQIDDMIAAASA